MWIRISVVSYIGSMFTKSLTVAKTEAVIFGAKGKVFDTDLKLKMCGKNLYSSHHVKYLGVYLD